MFKHQMEWFTYNERLATWSAKRGKKTSECACLESLLREDSRVEENATRTEVVNEESTSDITARRELVSHSLYLHLIIANTSISISIATTSMSIILFCPMICQPLICGELISIIIFQWTLWKREMARRYESETWSPRSLERFPPPAK